MYGIHQVFGFLTHGCTTEQAAVTYAIALGCSYIRGVASSLVFDLGVPQVNYPRGVMVWTNADCIQVGLETAELAPP